MELLLYSVAIYVGMVVGTNMPKISVQGHLFCCMWYTFVHVSELMCTFIVLDEHCYMCSVMLCVAHLHSWLDMLHVGTNMPGISVSGHVF